MTFKHLIACVITITICMAMITGTSYLIYLMLDRTMAWVAFAILSLDFGCAFVFRRNFFTGKNIDK